METRGIAVVSLCGALISGFALMRWFGTASQAFYQENANHALKLEVTGSSPEVFQVGEIRSIQGTIRNISSNPIQIKRIMISNCGCNGGTVEQAYLAPGQATRCLFKPKTAGFKSGVASSEFVVQTDDDKVLPIQGKIDYIVLRSVAFEPGSLDLGQMVVGEHVSRSFLMVVEDDGHPSPVVVSAPYPWLHVSVSPPITGPDGVTKYEIKVSGKVEAAVGYVHETIPVILKGFRGRDHEFHIDVFGSVGDNVQVEPTSLYFGYIAGTAPVSRELVLKHPSGVALVVQSLEGIRWGKVSFEQSQSVESTKLTIVVKPTENGSGGIDVLHIHTLYRNASWQIDVPCVGVK